MSFNRFYFSFVTENLLCIPYINPAYLRFFVLPLRSSRYFFRLYIFIYKKLYREQMEKIKASRFGKDLLPHLKARNMTYQFVQVYI